MTIVLEDNRTGAPYYKRQIKCPGHYLVPPTEDVYLREPVPLLKHCRNWVEYKSQRFNIKKTRIAHDKWGNKKIDWKKLYDLERKGIVKQPFVTASWAIEHIYDPLSFLCRNCDKRCLEGKNKINTTTIRRLNG